MSETEKNYERELHPDFPIESILSAIVLLIGCYGVFERLVLTDSEVVFRVSSAMWGYLDVPINGGAQCEVEVESWQR